MFETLRSAALFMRAATTARDAFGINLVHADKLANGRITALVLHAGLPDKWTREEAAVAGLSLSILQILDDHDGYAAPEWDLRHLARHAVIVDGWAAQGLVRPGVRDLFQDALDGVFASQEPQRAGDASR